MSVFGIDLGALASVVAVTRNGGVDVILNEVSKRETTTMVSLTDQERAIGEGALDRAVRNASNTIGCLKHLIGARANPVGKRDAELVQLEKKFLSCGTTEDAAGRLMFSVNYNGEPLELYPEQALAMFLTQLKNYVVKASNGVDSRDCVISVPCWYTAEQRKLVLQASEIAGLHCMSLINETTAASIDYGIFRGQTLPETEETAQLVAIVDFGYGATSVSISKFWKGHMKVLARISDVHVSTRTIDQILTEHFAKEIQKKYKVDILSNKRATIRLRQASERVKYLLSGNQVSPLHIENIMDVDINIPNFSRSDMEGLIAPMLERYKALIGDVVRMAGLNFTPGTCPVHEVEVIGGGCRIPILKAVTLEMFGKASYTMNATESTARGAAITAAVFSPKFQVREFVVSELPQYPVSLAYMTAEGDNVLTDAFLPAALRGKVNKVVTLLKGSGDYCPKALEVTIKRPDSFKLFAFYPGDHPEVHRYMGVEAAEDPNRLLVGEWTIGAPEQKNPPLNFTGQVKLQIKIHAGGWVTVDSATTQESYEAEETEEKKDPEHPDKPAEKVPVKKTKYRRHELSVTPNVGLIGLPAEVVVRAKHQEETMNKRDHLIVATKEARNHLEEYILDKRHKLADTVGSNRLSLFLTDEAKNQFASKSQAAETWLYDESTQENAKLQDYQSRSGELKAIVDPAIRRQRLADDLPFEQKQFVQKVQKLREMCLAKIGKAAHITEAELQGAASKCDDAVLWSESSLSNYLAQPKHVDPTFSVAQLNDKLKETEVEVKKVVDKKPPPPPPKPSESPKPDGAAANPPPPPPPPQQPNAADGSTASPPPPPPPTDQGASTHSEVPADCT